MGRTLDRDDLFELGKADILTKVASLQVRGYCVVQFLVMWIIMTHGNNTLHNGHTHTHTFNIISYNYMTQLLILSWYSTLHMGGGGGW